MKEKMIKVNDISSKFDKMNSERIATLQAIAIDKLTIDIQRAVDYKPKGTNERKKRQDKIECLFMAYACLGGVVIRLDTSLIISKDMRLYSKVAISQNFGVEIIDD